MEASKSQYYQMGFHLYASILPIAPISHEGSSLKMEESDMLVCKAHSTPSASCLYVW